MQTNIESNNFIFSNRLDGAQNLLEELPKDKLKQSDWVILALSRGGIVIAQELSKALEIDFDVFIISAIYAPQNDECEIAMISETKDILINSALADSFGISKDFIYDEAQKIYFAKVILDISWLRATLPLSELKGKKVLLIDEGCETGFRVMCAIKSVLNIGVAKVSIATPVMPEDLYHDLELIVDNVYCPKKIDNFTATRDYYHELEKPKKSEIKKLLEESRYYLPFKKERGDE